MKMAEFTPSKEICYYFKNIIIVIIIFETTQFLIIEEKAHVCDIFCMNYTRLSYVIKDKFIILLHSVQKYKAVIIIASMDVIKKFFVCSVCHNHPILGL